MASIQCPHCAAKLNVPEKTLGKQGRCPKCQQKFLVQLPQPADEYALAPLDNLAPLASAPLGNLNPLGQPLPSVATPLGAPVAKRESSERAGSGDWQKHIPLLVGGGIAALVALVAVVVGLVVVFSRGGDVASGESSWNGKYAVVDSLASLPAEPVEGSVPLDTESSDSEAVWTFKPDPPSAAESLTVDTVGALSPGLSLLLASPTGPYAVGLAPESGPGQRDKVLKNADGSPGEVVSIDTEPHPILDVRTGKPVGRFPAEARIRFNCRLSPDGRYLASSEFQAQQGYSTRVLKDELVVWQRDADQPSCRWPLPGPVLWADFIGPDRLAFYHLAPSLQFVVLDVAKGTPIVTVPLPGEEFSYEFDSLHRRKNFTSYRVWTSSGAVSPGGNWIALGGSANIVLVDTAGRVAGKLPIEPVKEVRSYLGVSFSGDGTQLRALTRQGEATPVLYVWSLADKKLLYKKPCPFQFRAGENPYEGSAPGPAILDGPSPSSLLVGHLLYDTATDQKVAELPYQPLRWAGPDRLLALGSLAQAANANELSQTADFVPRGKSLIVTALDGAALLAKAPQPPADPRARPMPTPPDRSQITATRLQPPATWAVKPGAEGGRPTGPLPRWPHAFAATEAAVISESLSWIRYDLNTGNTIGNPIDLWPGQPAPSERVGWHTAALTRDGQRLALVDAKDRGRVDVWDVTGKRLIGLRPYEDGPLLWLGWSADGKLLTADDGHLTGWDVANGQAAFEVEGKFHWFASAPGAEWVIAMTPAWHLFFVDAATGSCLGHIPASTVVPAYALSPDGKTLLRFKERNLQVWDLQTGTRLSARETPLVPITLATAPTADAGPTGVFWTSARSFLTHTKSPGEQQPRYYLYDLDTHTHTYGYAPSLGTFQNDSLGRAWMTSPVGGGESWVAPNIPGVGAFPHTLAFAPGTTVRVEVNVGDRKASEQTAEKMAVSLASQGFKIGPDGWVLRADHTTGNTSTDLTDLRGQGGISVATLNITWRLLDPAGNEAWKGTSGGKFDPFTSKYVVVGSRRTDMAPGGLGGGSTEVRLDYQGKGAIAAQIEEILEKHWYPGVPTCLVKNEKGYVALPLAAPEQ